MEFREISTFLQVAQYQSFSKAARHLGYSQAAVTIQIKQLEQELGVHLFDRIGKQISLTHQGQVFYRYAVSIRNDLEQAKNAVSDPSTLSGKLCLGTIESICASIFPDLLAEYHRLHPEVTISIVTDSPLYPCQTPYRYGRLRQTDFPIRSDMPAVRPSPLLPEYPR